MKGNFKAKHALTVLASAPLKNELNSFLPTLQSTTIQLIEELEASEKANVGRGVLAGVGLLAMKAALGHGEFGPWMEKHAQRSPRRCQHLMKLALHFMEKMRVDQPELLALTHGGTTADAKKSWSSLKEKVEKFAAGRGLTDLLIARGIVSAPQLDDDAELDGPSENARPVLAAGGGNDHFLADVSEWLLNLRKRTTDPEQLKKIPRKEIKALVKEVAAYAEDLNKAVEALSQK